MSTPVKTVPDVKILCYPREAIQVLRAESFTVQDVLAGLIRRGRGESAAVPGENYLDLGRQWADQPEFESISGDLVFITLSGAQSGEGTSSLSTGAAGLAGDGGAVAGFVLKGREVPLNCVALPETLSGDSGIRDPQGEARFDKVRWQGDGDAAARAAWSTYLPEEQPLRTRIYFHEQRPDEVRTAWTQEYFRAKQQMRFDIGWRGIARGQTNPAAFRLAIADGEWSIVWRHNAAPALARQRNGQDVDVMLLEGAGKADFKGNTTVWIYRWGGRLVIRIGNHLWDLADVAKTGAVGNGSERTAEVTWPQGRLMARTYGVMATVGVSLISYRHGDGTQLSAEFERSITRAIKGAHRHDAQAGHTLGWRTHQATTEVALTPSRKNVHYACTLNGSKDGIDTPLVTAVCGHWGSQFGYQSLPPLDLRPAALSASYDGAEPDIMPGASMSVEVDRVRLGDLALEQGVDWRDFASEYHPVDFQCRWQYDDGTTDPEYHSLLRGYIQLIRKQTRGIIDQKMTLTFHDPIMRLQPPASFIGTEYPALDFFFMRKLREAIEQGKANNKTVLARSLFGGECIQEMLRIALGDEEADILNGTGNPLEFQPSSQPPLLSADTDIAGLLVASGFNLPLQNGFVFPPRFGQNILKWMKEIADLEKAVFFYGYNSAVPTNWPIPIYGRLSTIFKNQPTYVLPDAVYDSGDWNRVIQTMETTTLPDRDFNDFRVWGNHPSQTRATGLMPTTPEGMGYDRLPPSDPKAEEYTWRRTNLQRAPFLLNQAYAQGLATVSMLQYLGVALQHPTLDLRGDPLLRWGVKIRPRLEKLEATGGGDISDDTIGLHDQDFRMGKVGHRFNFVKLNADSWRTTIHVRPLSAFGL